MRENRTYGSEGGEAKSLPYPYREGGQHVVFTVIVFEPPRIITD